MTRFTVCGFKFQQLLLKTSKKAFFSVKTPIAMLPFFCNFFLILLYLVLSQRGKSRCLLSPLEEYFVKSIYYIDMIWRNCFSWKSARKLLLLEKSLVNITHSTVYAWYCDVDFMKYLPDICTYVCSSTDEMLISPHSVEKYQKPRSPSNSSVKSTGNLFSKNRWFDGKMLVFLKKSWTQF